MTASLTNRAPRHGVSLQVQGAQNPLFWDRGIARYIVEHASALLAIAPDRVHSVQASTRMGISPSVRRLVSSGKLRRDRGEPLDADGRRPAMHHVMSPLEWGYSIDDVWPLWARDPGCLRVVTLYDLIPFVFPEWYKALLTDRVGYDARVELIRRADHVLAISEHTAADAQRLLGIPEERITVIGAAATSNFRDLWPSRDEALAFVRRRFEGIEEDFVFYVGGQDQRKNMAGVVEAWGRLDEATRDRVRLVITCELSPDKLAALERHAARHGLRRADLQLTGRVSDEELAALYRACSLFVFASLYEGSGLPILEAMTAGAPVVAARTSTGPELLGESDGTFDPLDPGAMARAIAEPLHDPARLEHYRRRSTTRIAEFSWRQVAERTLAGYDQALARRRPVAPAVRRARRRIALLAPGPRAPRAADQALQRLVDRLGTHADVEVIRPGAGADDVAAAPARFELRRGRGFYDQTIHVLGGEPAHRYAYEALVRDPGGVVLFEDVRLGDFHRWYAARVGGPLWLRRELEQQYGEVLPQWVELRGAVTADEVDASGLLLTRHVQKLASALVAPSPAAAALLGLDRFGEAGVPILVAAPVPPPPAPGGSGGSTIVSVEPPGSAAATRLVDALALLPQASLVLLHDHADDHAARTALLERAGDRGVAGRLTLLTPASHAERSAVVRGATVGAVPVAALDAERIALGQECLSAGVPVVTVEGWPGSLEGVELVADDPSASVLARALGRHLAAERTRRPVELAVPPLHAWLELLGVRAIGHAA